jgi:TM2 domain-containing membrane protein YozV
MTEKTYCSACGKQIDSRAEICPKCGVRQTSSKGGNADKKDKTMAALLALFLGGLGIHKFYLGDSKKGVLYLIFFWTFIPAILALIDAIRMFGMSDSEFQQYVRNIKK